jgi:hypothetical protein
MADEFTSDEPYEIDLDSLFERARRGEQAMLAAAGLDIKPQRSRVSAAAATSAREPSAAIVDIAAALKLIPNPDLPRKLWKDVLMAIWAASAGSKEGLEAARQWSKKSKKHTGSGGLERAWAEITASPPSKIGFGTLFYKARQVDPNFRKPSDIALDPPPADAPEGRAQQPDLFGRDIATNSSTSEAGEDTGTPTSVRLGDLVQWTSHGQDQLPAPVRIEWVSEDGALRAGDRQHDRKPRY